jgi:hypothetical protein
MEPFARIYQSKCSVSQIIDEFYFRNVDSLFDCLKLRWDVYCLDRVDHKDHLLHEAVLDVLDAIESHPVPETTVDDAPPRHLLVENRERRFIMLRCYREWYERPENPQADASYHERTRPSHGGLDYAAARVRTAPTVGVGAALVNESRTVEMGPSRTVGLIARVIGDFH